jgi:siroheme synthase (precorrin-2 oxidase/ferrochelatase)
MKYVAETTVAIEYVLTDEIMDEIRQWADSNFPSEDAVLEFLRDRFMSNFDNQTAEILRYEWEWEVEETENA